MIVIVFAATCASSVPMLMPVSPVACAVRAFSAASAFLLAGRYDKHTAPGGRHVESVFALEEQLRRRNGRLAQPGLQHLAAERQHFAYPRRIDEHPAAAPVLPQKEIQQFVGGVAVKNALHLHMQVVLVVMVVHLKIGAHARSPSCRADSLPKRLSLIHI